MKKYLSIIITLFVTLFAVNSFAYTPPPAPAHGGYILDETSKLSQTEIEQLNRKIETIKQSTKNEYGIALIQSTGGEDIADVGQTIFRAWGIGDKQLNNGVLLVIAMAEHKTRIQTGKGVEGDLPDLKASDILNNTLKPYLKQGQFYQGINATLDAIATSVDSRAKAPVSTPANDLAQTSNSVDSSTDNGGGILVIVLLVMGAVVGIGVFLSVRSSRKEEERLRRLEREESLSRWNRERAEYKIKTQNLTTSPEVPTKKPYFDTYSAAAVGTTVATVSAAEKREADARRRRKEEEDTKKRSSGSSSYSSPSYSSYDSGSSWSSGGGGFDGGGFGGGDSGGGGASGGW